MKQKEHSFHKILICVLIVSITGMEFACHTSRHIMLSTQDSMNLVSEQWKYIDTVSLPVSFGYGRHATPEEIAVLDIDVRPDGTGLPTGNGNAIAGREIYLEKCAVCHGNTGVEGTIGGRLVSPAHDTLAVEVKTIGNYWPYATTIYDYINRAMPFNEPGSLTSNEVYALTAYLLYANKIIDSNTVINSSSLPKVVMPAQPLFVPDNRTREHETR